MTDVFSKQKRSQVMSAICSTGNKETEGRLLAILKANRITGWRRHLPLPGKPDFAFPRERLALFVDGCFWHGCQKHGRIPSSNQAYWREKIARNIARDKSVRAQLRRSGWRVLRVWDHDLANQAMVSRRIKQALTKPRLEPARI